MGYDTGLADRLRAEGLNVVEVAGWQTRGSSSFNPQGFLWHHTAGPRSGNSPSLGICINGRSDLPGPLCNVFMARDATVYVVAAGRANHAGSGGWMGLSGNSSVFGLEIENVGNSSEPWNLFQLAAAAKIAAACIRGRIPVNKCCHHKEWTSRKPDMHTVTGNVMRELTQNILNTPAGVPAGPPVDLAAIAAGIAEARKHTLREGDTGDAVKWLQAGINNVSGRGLVVDGIFGATTAQAVKDLQRFVGASETGIVDGAIWALLYDPKPEPTPDQNAVAVFLNNVAIAAQAKPLLKQGMRGEGVKDLQRSLNGSMGNLLAVDGVFGPGTAKVVKRYQAQRGLVADGIVGRDTWTHLIVDAIKRLR